MQFTMTHELRVELAGLYAEEASESDWPDEYTCRALTRLVAVPLGTHEVAEERLEDADEDELTPAESVALSLVFFGVDR